MQIELERFIDNYVEAPGVTQLHESPQKKLQGRVESRRGLKKDFS